MPVRTSLTFALRASPVGPRPDACQMIDEVIVEQQYPSEVNVAVSLLALPWLTVHMFEHVLYKIVRNRPNMPAGLNIVGQQVKKRRDRRVFMLGVGMADDDLSVAVEFECHPGTDTGPQRLADRPGQGDLARRRHGGNFAEDWHDRRSSCAASQSGSGEDFPYGISTILKMRGQRNLRHLPNDFRHPNCQPSDCPCNHDHLSQ